MDLYSKRHCIRAPQKKTYVIHRDEYSILLSCCIKYQNNLTHIFPRTVHDKFTDSNYIEFDDEGFSKRIKIKIPALFRDGDGRISTPQNQDQYDQYALLDLIEFFANHIHDISIRWNNDQYRNYQTIDCLDSSDVIVNFQGEINEIFTESGLLYELTDEQIIERIVELSPLTTEIENSFHSIPEKGIRELLKEAVAAYKTPNPAARQYAVEKLWDAFERLKTYYSALDKKKSVKKIENDMAQGDTDFFNLVNSEFLALTTIGNSYRIRHHETDKIEITDNRYYEYLFNRCLSLLALAIQYLRKEQ